MYDTQSQLATKMLEDLKYYKKRSAQLSARFQILRENMEIDDWADILYQYPEAKDWFDEDGVPK